MFILSEGYFRRVRRCLNVGEVDGAGSGHARESDLRLGVSDPLLSRLHHRLHLPRIREVIQFQSWGEMWEVARG